MPFHRDILLALGVCSVSKKSCSNILNAGPGSAITIVVGGAAESLSARPGTANLTLRRRLGFIKLAIQHGADLVPVFSFGENDVIGKPIHVEKCEKPDIEEVVRVQQLYIEELTRFVTRLALLDFQVIYSRCSIRRIWNAYKDEFAKARLQELNIID
ncbi:hypothetical protein C0991_006301 [Blastosporella zonata]|nr:hypothetical protein C0991_006301 [Blastosporella zonata]